MDPQRRVMKVGDNNGRAVLTLRDMVAFLRQQPERWDKHWLDVVSVPVVLSLPYQNIVDVVFNTVTACWLALPSS